MTWALATPIGLRQQHTLLIPKIWSLLTGILGVSPLSCSQGRDKVLPTFMFLDLGAGPKYLSCMVALNLSLGALSVAFLATCLGEGTIRSRRWGLTMPLF